MASKGTEPYFDEDVSKSRALFENLFESSPDAIVEANREGLIVRVNAQVESMFGYTRGELIGQPVNILVPERFRSGAHHPPAKLSCLRLTRGPWAQGSSFMVGARTAANFP